MATILSLPPIAILASAAAELVEETTDRALINALNKAILHLHEGIEITPTAGGYLLPSGTRGGVVHRVSTVHGCSCEAGQKQRQCWHAATLTIIEKAQTRAIPMGDRLAARRKALAEMDELFAA
jgi:hypothetical protein